MGASATLMTYARAREAAYLQHGRLNGFRAKALTKIRKVADFYSLRSDMVQLIAVNSVKAEILALLPNENSRYQKQREQVLTLIKQSKQLAGHASSANPVHQTADGRSAAAPARAEGTQLNLI